MSGGGIVSAYLGNTPLLINSSNTISFRLNNNSDAIDRYSIVTSSSINKSTGFAIYCQSSIPNFQIVKNGTKYLPTIIMNIKNKDGNDCWKQNGDVLEFTENTSNWDAPLKLSESQIFQYPSDNKTIESAYFYYAEAKFKANIEDDPNDDFEFSVKVIKTVTPTTTPTNPPSSSGHKFVLSTNFGSTLQFKVSFYSTSSGTQYEGFNISASKNTWNKGLIDNYYMSTSIIDKIKITFTISQSTTSSVPWTPNRVGFNIYITNSIISGPCNYTDFAQMGHSPVKQDSVNPNTTWNSQFQYTFNEEITGLSIPPGSQKWIYIVFV